MVQGGGYVATIFRLLVCVLHFYHDYLCILLVSLSFSYPLPFLLQKNAALEMKLQQMVIIIHLLLRQEIIRQCPRVKFIDSRLHCLTLTAIPVVLPKSNLICLSGHSLLRICVTSSLIVVDRRRWSISTTTYSAAGASTVKHEGAWHFREATAAATVESHCMAVHSY